MVSAKARDAALDTLTKLRTGSPSVEAFVFEQSTVDGLVLSKILFDADLRKVFLEAARTKVDNTVDRTMREYGPVVLLSGGECGYADGAVGNLAAREAALAAGNAPLFDPKKGREIALLVLHLVVNGQTVNMYREIRPTAWLDRSRGFAAVWADGRFNRVTGENLIVFDNNFDTIVTGGVAFFTAKAKFERMFDYTARIRAAAKEAFVSVTQHLKIKNFDQMQEACTSDPNMVAKMASIQRSLDADPQYANSMTMTTLLRFIDGHPETKVDLDGVGPNRELVFHPDPQRRYKILHLLDDDYLRSELTSNVYEANSKSSPLA